MAKAAAKTSSKSPEAPAKTSSKSPEAPKKTGSKSPKVPAKAGIRAKKVPKAALVMGSDSDYPILKSCIKTLKDFGAEVEVLVCSAHRTPEKAAEFASEAEDNGIEVIIAAAGKAAHLPGVLAAYTTLPVIGIPIRSSLMDGLDSLLSIVQMPAGIPVATVAVDGAENAALLALQIMSGSHPELREKMREYKRSLAQKVEKKNADLRKLLLEEA